MKQVVLSPALAYLLATKPRSKATGRYVAATNSLSDREASFDTDLEMKLTAIGMDPDTRRQADTALDEWWESQRATLLRSVTSRGFVKREVIIGSGYHAAVYAAIRVAMGFPRPLVIEADDRAGGVFAMTNRPVFYMNTRNRPGGPGVAGDYGAQPNYLPGAPVQPSNLSGSDYQTNADMAWIIRMTLAQNADVLTGFRATEYQRYGDFPAIISGSGRKIPTSRLIDARGLGTPRDEMKAANGRNIMTFPDFMRRMNQPMPMRGLRRVAVIGDGDAARVAVEQLLGIGPQTNVAMAIDKLDLIDWYGPRLPNSTSGWRDTQRTRYLSIGQYLRDGDVGTRQVRIFNRRSFPIALPYGASIVGRTYDLVVLATGFTEPVGLSGVDSADDMDLYKANQFRVARRNGDIYKIGPAARLGFSDAERDDGLDKATSMISMARLGPRTAALAATLPEPRQVGEERASRFDPIFSSTSYDREYGREYNPFR